MIGAVAVVLTLYSTRLYFQEVSQKLNRTLAERMVSEQVLMQEGRVNDAALKDIFHQLMVINPSIELYLLDPQGTILTFSASPGKVKRQRISLDPLNRFLSGGEDFPILGDDPRDLTRKKYFRSIRLKRWEGPSKVICTLFWAVRSLIQSCRCWSRVISSD